MKDENKKKKRKNVLIVVLVALGVLLINALPFILILFGVYVTSYSHEVMKDGSVQINDGDLVISKDLTGSYYEEDGCYYVQGLLTNKTDKTYEYVSLTYTFYDKDGYTLGNSDAYLEKIDENSTWKFKVSYCDIDSSEVDSFKFKDVY